MKMRTSILMCGMLFSQMAWANKYKDAARKLGGLDQVNVTIAIDFTGSNAPGYQINELYGSTLHSVDDPSSLNPYELALRSIFESVMPMDKDHKITMYGFGSGNTQDKRVFNIGQAAKVIREHSAKGDFDALENDFSSVTNVEQAIANYKTVVPEITLNGPTSFVPFLEEIQSEYAVAARTGRRLGFTLAIILTDGDITNSLAEANYRKFAEIAKTLPVAFIVIGVGEGGDENFRDLEILDSGMKRYGAPDLVQAVVLKKYIKTKFPSGKFKSLEKDDFLNEAFKELPKQIDELKKLGRL